MAAAVAVEDLLASQADLDGTAERERGLRDDDLVIERVALPSESAAVRSRDDADVGGRHFEHLRERAVDVVRGLSARPQRELPVLVDGRDGGVLLEGKVRVPLIEEGVVEDTVRLGEAALDVAEGHRDALVDVSFLAIVVDARLGRREGLLGLGDRRERLVVDVDEVERLEGRQLVLRDDGGHGIADEADLVEAQRLLVLAHGEDPVFDRKVLPGQDEANARAGECARGVDRLDPRVRKRRAQELRVEHLGQDDIVGEAGLSGDLRAPVDAPARHADDPERAAMLFALRAAVIGAAVPAA